LGFGAKKRKDPELPGKIYQAAKELF